MAPVLWVGRAAEPMAVEVVTMAVEVMAAEAPWVALVVMVARSATADTREVLSVMAAVLMAEAVVMDAVARRAAKEDCIMDSHLCSFRDKRRRGVQSALAR